MVLGTKHREGDLQGSPPPHPPPAPLLPPPPLSSPPQAKPTSDSKIVERIIQYVITGTHSDAFHTTATDAVRVIPTSLAGATRRVDGAAVLLPGRSGGGGGGG